MYKNSISLSSSKRKFSRLNSIENHAVPKQSISIQTDFIEKSSKFTNTPNYVDDMLIQGKHMNDEEFEKFIKGKNKIENQFSQDVFIFIVIITYVNFCIISIIRFC